MARVVRREKRQRGFFGWVFLVLFWGWNALMAWLMVLGAGALNSLPETSDRAEQAGRALGGAPGLDALEEGVHAARIELGARVIAQLLDRIGVIAQFCLSE